MTVDVSTQFLERAQRIFALKRSIIAIQSEIDILEEMNRELVEERWLEGAEGNSMSLVNFPYRQQKR